MTLFSEISGKVATNLEGFEVALEEFCDALPLSRAWVQREWNLSNNVRGRSLLVGAKVSLLEAGTAWAIGSNRGAASSLRAYIENVFAWLYYKDHPVEYGVVESMRGDVMLPKAIQGYMKQIDHGFEKSYLELSKNSLRGRDSEYYYTILSQFVHAHPSFSTLSDNILDLAVSSPRDPGFLVVCRNADEFISDNFTTYYRGSWDDLPKLVTKSVSDRLNLKTKDFLGT